jgi:hypothetical protein
LIPTPIRQVLSTLPKIGFQVELLSGQACVFYPAAQVSKDIDLVLLADDANCERLRHAVRELGARQWLATQGLTEEAVREALPVEFDGVQGRIFRAEHLVAIAASVGRTKDRARIEQMLEQAALDRALLDAILSRHHLKLPGQ